MGRKTPFVRTPSDRVVQLVDPVAWEASVGAAIHVGCEAYNALGIEGMQLNCEFDAEVGPGGKQ